MMADTETPVVVAALPGNGNYHVAKRDLLRYAVRRGRIRMTEILAALPAPHISPSEMELFLFSLNALAVDVIDDTPG
jgi:hypothetical protein